MFVKGFVALSLALAAHAAPAAEDTPVTVSAHAEMIPDSYIVKFKSHVKGEHTNNHHMWLQGQHEEIQTELRKRSLPPHGGLKHTFSIGEGFVGYSGHFDEKMVKMIKEHPDVESVEPDTKVWALDAPEEQDKCHGDLEKMAPWGLARISHRKSLSFSTYNQYLYAQKAGEGVDVYVIDTGTNVDHVDFEGRAKWGATIPDGDEDVDGNGHGTHCSGTIAGKKYGVAKAANVYAVKVLRSNGSGTMSDVVKGVEYAANQHLKALKEVKDGKRKGFKGSAANMSLGGGKTTTLDQVVNAAVDAGLHFAVAAGNDNADACNYSPAAAQKAITVGASGLDDSRAYFSNHGKCVDIFAPGLQIESTWTGGKHAVKTISGTSMASPHIAGLLAYFLSLQPALDSDFAVESITPAQMKANMISIATLDALDDLPKGTPNILAWNGGGCDNFTSIVDEGSYKLTKETRLN
jgi:cerevisin